MSSSGAVQVPATRGDGSIQHYDPAKGVKTIAAAETAEKYFARARDATKLFEAVELKLTEQRKFVLWWDGQQKQHGKLGSRSETQFSYLDALGLDKATLHRWRTRLKDDRKFEGSLEAAQERCKRVCEADKGATDQKGATGTGENEWYTPIEYLAMARQVLGEIDLDPATSEVAQARVQAKRVFTVRENGLAQEWCGRVWLNPPYAQPAITDFVKKMAAEVEAKRVTAAIMLTHNYTDTEWFHVGVKACAAICFTRGRVKFEKSNGEVAAPTQGQAFFYFGEDVDVFADCFSSIGFVVVPRHG